MSASPLARSILLALALLFAPTLRAQFAPIKIPPDAKTTRDFIKAQHAWAERALIAPFRERAAGKPWVEAAATFVGRAIDEWRVSRRDTKLLSDQLPRLARDGQALLAQGCDDPLITYFTAWARWQATEENYGSREAFDKARKAAELLPNQAALAWIATCDFLRTNDHVKQGAGNAPKRFAALAGAMWRDGSYQPDEDFIYLRHVSHALWADDYFEKLGDPLLIALQPLELPPWVRETLVGQVEINRAWQSRGDDFANKVTPEGWEGFEEHLEKARRHLTHAWQLRKDRPDAAARMIVVAMGGGAKQVSARAWFDRAIAAECDFEWAYEALQNASEARWGGSNRLILALGKAALATGRFDTDVPLRLIKVVWCINYNRDDTVSVDDLRHTLRRKDIGPLVVQCLHGYANEPSRPEGRRVWLAQAAVFEWLSGDSGAAAKSLAECGPDPLPFEVRSFLPRFAEDENSFRAEVALLNSPARGPYEQAKNQRAFESYDTAAETFTKAAELVTGLAAERLRSLAAVCKVEAKLATGAWATIPPDPTLQSWLQRSGAWSATPDGFPSLTEGDGPVRVSYAARVGREFEMKATLDLAGEPKAKWQAGLFFADFSLGGFEPGYRGGFVRIDKGKSTGTARACLKEYVLGLKDVTCPLLPHNEVTMRYENAHLTWTFNGVPIHYNVRIGGIQPWGMVGFGSYRHTSGVTISLSKLEIRRLDLPPAENP